MENKNLAKFFADTIRTRELTDEQSITLSRLLFPGIGDDENTRLRDGARDMASAYMRWEAKQGSKEKGGKGEHHEDPMTDDEIEALAAII